MKKYMIGMLMAVLMIMAVLPQRVSAAESSPDEISLEKKDDKSALVSLRLSNAAGEKISSLQFSLKMKEGTKAEFTFDEKIKERAKISDQKYHEDTGILNVYIAGNEPLYREGETVLALGIVSVDRFPADITAGDVGIVRGNDVEMLDLTASITLGGTTTPTTPSNPINPSNPTTSTTPSASPTPSGTPTPSVTPTPSGAPTPSETPVLSITPTPSVKPTPSTPGGEADNTKAPKTPKVSKVTNVASGIMIKWNKVANADGYYVWRKASGKKWVKIATVKGIGKVSYIDKTVKKKDGVKYTYSIQAYNNGKTSGYIKTAEPVARMRAPSLSKPKANGSGTMLVKWKKNAKADGYVIQYSRSSDFKKNCKKERIRSGKTTQTTVSGLKKGKVQYVRIRSYKKVKGKYHYSAWGNAKKVKIK